MYEHDDINEDGAMVCCPLCGGQSAHLGNLGTREHFRCIQCGMDFSQPAPEVEQ